MDLSDAEIELLSLALVFLGILVTIIHFNRNQSNQLKIVEKQILSQRQENQEINLTNFQVSFWEKQLELYIQASSLAAELTQFELNSERYIETRKMFYKLFWGPMSIVEDLTVKHAMQAYSSQLIEYEKSKSDQDLKRLQQKSFQLAKTCRMSAINRWDLKEFELDTDPPAVE